MKDYTKLNNGLLFGLVIAIAAFLATLAWLIGAIGENVELKNDLEQRDRIIGEQWKVINKDNKDIEQFKDNEKRLIKQLAECNTGKEKLSREKGFLFPWGSEIVSRVDDTVDFRSLTSIACDDIARWLFSKIGEFRRFYKEGEK
jgi:hypothetical protein